VTRLIRFNTGNYSVATQQTQLVTGNVSVTNEEYDYGSLYDGPNYGAIMEDTATNLSARSIAVVPINSNVPGPWVSAGAAVDQRAFYGRSNQQDIIFYPGSYVVESIIDPNTFTVESIGPDFTVVPYSSVVNFNVVTVLDNVSPGAVGPALYTSPSQEGIVQANFPPPLAKDIETFRSYGFYANATIQAYLPVTLFSVGTEAIDLNIGDMVLIRADGFSSPAAVVTASATEDFANNKFKVVTGAGTAYENIRQTVESLSQCINRYADARHGCVLVKNEDTFSPGSMYIRSLYFDTSVVFEVRRGTDPVYINNPIAMGAWSPSTRVTSGPTQQPNVIYYSKPGQGGAVPLLNSVRVGSDNSAILRIKATREVLFVFKTEGVFAMRGYAPPWQVDPFDLSNTLMLPDALCQLDNNIFCITDHGLMKVSDSGIELISLPIQNKIEEHFSSQSGQLSFSSERAYMFGDPSDHKLHLMIPRPPSDDARKNQLLVYDTYTNTWFEYGWNGVIDKDIHSTTPVTINFDNRSNHGLHYKKTNACIWVNDVSVFTERKTYTDHDYIDDIITSGIVTAISADGLTIDVTYYPDYGTPPAELFAAGVLCGDKHYFAELMITNVPSQLVTLTLTSAFTGNLQDTVEIYNPIWTEALYAPTYEVNAAALNHFREVNSLFKDAHYDFMRMIYIRPNEPGDTTGQSEGYVVVDGTDEFGATELIREHYQTRTLVPREQQRCSVLTVGFQMSISWHSPEIEGMVILYNPGPMRRRR